MSKRWGNDTWPCSYAGDPADGPRFCKHPECKHGGGPLRTAAAPPPPAHAGGLSDDQVIRIHALAAASAVAAPGEDNTITTYRAGIFARWIKNGS
jgi:hypothetical protein